MGGPVCYCGCGIQAGRQAQCEGLVQVDLRGSSCTLRTHVRFGVCVALQHPLLTCVIITLGVLINVQAKQGKLSMHGPPCDRALLGVLACIAPQ
jgi:hypothetical protein